MSKTKRHYHDHMCLRKMSNKPHKVEKAKMLDVNNEEQLPINNRPTTKEVPEPWNDKCVSALGETKYLWKNGLEIEKEDDGCYNIYFAEKFICNLDKQQLQFFPWTTYLPLEQPPNLDNFVLV